VGKKLFGGLKSLARRVGPDASGDGRRGSAGDSLSTVRDAEAVSETTELMEGIPSGRELGKALGGGLLGNALGGLLSMGLKAVGEQVAETAGRVAATREAAARLLREDEGVRRALGDPISVGETPLSVQTSSSIGVDGVEMNVTRLILAVAGPRGQAAADVEDRGGQGEDVVVSLRLPTGGTLPVVGASSGFGSDSWDDPRVSGGRRRDRRGGGGGGGAVVDAEIIDVDVS